MTRCHNYKQVLYNEPQHITVEVIRRLITIVHCIALNFCIQVSLWFSELHRNHEILSHFPYSRLYGFKFTNIFVSWNLKISEIWGFVAFDGHAQVRRSLLCYIFLTIWTLYDMYCISIGLTVWQYIIRDDIVNATTINEHMLR